MYILQIVDYNTNTKTQQRVNFQTTANIFIHTREAEEGPKPAKF